MGKESKGSARKKPGGKPSGDELDEMEAEASSQVDELTRSAASSELETAEDRRAKYDRQYGFNRSRRNRVPKPDVDPDVAAAQSQLKRTTFQRLVKYRAQGGLGCLNPLSKLVDLPTDHIRAMLASESRPYEMWEAVKKGLDEIGFELEQTT